MLAHHDQGLQSEEQGAQEANKHISQDGQIVLIIIADKTGLKYGPFFCVKIRWPDTQQKHPQQSSISTSIAGKGENLNMNLGKLLV